MLRVLRPLLSASLVNRTMSNLSGKIAIVTGSTEGLGLSIAERLGKDGAKIVISSRKQPNVDRAVEELKSLNVDATGVVCHVGKEEHRQNLLKHAINRFGGVDILINNAGINPIFGPILDTSEDAWDKIFDVNVKAAFLLTKDCVPKIAERGGGSIIFMSSQAGFQPSQLIGAYSVSKTALLGLTKALAPQCAQYNIRVNCVAPSVIETKFSHALMQSDAVKHEIESFTPLKRFGKVEEVSGVVSFLVSSDASYITGETITICGGMPSRL